MFLLIICLFTFVYLLNRIRAKKLDVKYTLPWLLLDGMMMLMAVFPNIVVWLSRMLGILTPSNMVFFAALIFLLIIVFYMSHTISRLNSEIKELAQRIALSEIKDDNGED